MLCSPPHLPETKVLNERDRDGSIATDSAVSWFGDTVSGVWRTGATFQCYQTAYPNADYAWSLITGGALTPFGWSGLQSRTKDSWIELTFPGVGLSALALNQTDILVVSVTDKDDPASQRLSNGFTIRWHLPYENWVEYAPRKQVWDYPLLTIDSPGYAIINGSIGASWQFHSYYWGATETALSLLEDVVPNYGGLFAVAGFIIGQYGPQESNGSASFNDCWALGTEGGSTYYPDKNDSRKNEYTMKPRLRQGHTVAFWEGEHYHRNGYAGQDKRATRRFDGRRDG